MTTFGPECSTEHDSRERRSVGAAFTAPADSVVVLSAASAGARPAAGSPSSLTGEAETGLGLAAGEQLRQKSNPRDSPRRQTRGSRSRSKNPGDRSAWVFRSILGSPRRNRSYDR